MEFEFDFLPRACLKCHRFGHYSSSCRGKSLEEDSLPSSNLVSRDLDFPNRKGPENPNKDIKSLQAKLLLARELASQHNIALSYSYEDICNMGLEKIKLWLKDSTVCHLLSLATNSEVEHPCPTNLPDPAHVPGNPAPCSSKAIEAPVLPAAANPTPQKNLRTSDVAPSSSRKSNLRGDMLSPIAQSLGPVNSALINTYEGSDPTTTDQYP